MRSAQEHLRQPLVASVGVQCHAGTVRTDNQDRVSRASTPLGDLYIVADGVGGYENGAEAAQAVVDGFARELSQHARANAADALKSAAQTLNRELEQRGGTKNPPSKMSSTVVLALVANRAATIAHLGDSRAYLIRAGRMSQLTRDHSVTQRLIDQGLMGASEAREHSSASVLTQALGQPGEVDIGISELELYHGDALLLCSDGLWAYASDGDIEAIASSSELSPGGVADALMHLALQGGGGDNVSVQFLRFSATQAPVVAPMRFLGVPARVALPLAAALAIAAAVGAGLTAWNLTHSPAAAASEPALSSFAADPSRPDSPRLAPVHVVVDNGARVRWIGGLRKLKDIPAMEIEPSGDAELSSATATLSTIENRSASRRPSGWRKICSCGPRTPWNSSRRISIADQRMYLPCLPVELRYER